MRVTGADKWEGHRKQPSLRNLAATPGLNRVYHIVPMPELPEVESIKRYLVAQNIPNSTIQRVEIGWPDSIAAPAADIETFANRVSRKRINTINRRGKYIVSTLSDQHDTESHLVLHMGMTGSLHVRNPSDPPVKYRRAAIFLEDNRRIELNDYRRWGKLWALDNPSDAYPNLGPEPWDLTPDEFANRLRPRRSRIKPALLDQSIIAGVGNIYADESLHQTGISPLRRANRISTQRLTRLHANIIDTLNHAIQFISTHPSQDGSPYVVDAYDDRMRITRTPNSPCPTCQHPISSRQISGRTAYHCPKCQH